MAVLIGVPISRPVAGQVPDTLDWKRYFPLEVGNQWQYADGLSYWRERIVGDTLISENVYAIRLVEAGSNPGELTSSRRSYERHVDDGAYIAEARILPGDTNFTDVWRGDVCAADAAFDSLGDCPTLQARNNVYGGYGGAVEIGRDVIDVAAIKEFDTSGAFIRTAADIGPVLFAFELGSTATLEYAYVGGVAYGSPVVPTPSETVIRDRSSLDTAIYPVPAAGHVWVDVRSTSSSRVSIEVLTVLGQVVLRHEVDGTIGQLSRTRVDLGELASGFYLMVASNRGNTATKPLFIIVQ